MTGVTGWLLANPCSHDGIVWTGTNALLAYGGNITRKVNPFAASGVLASSPIAAESAEMASTNSSRMPAAASHWPGHRNPGAGGAEAGGARPALAGVGTVVADADHRTSTVDRASGGHRGPAGDRAVRRRDGAGDPEPELTRDRVVRAAIRVADAEGLAAVSMRRVAAELGVATMSLYRHVPGKDDLLLLMADMVYGETPVPDTAAVDWRDGLERYGQEMWAICRRHPWIAQVISFTRPMLAPNGMAHTDSAMRALDGLGLDLSTVLYAVLAVSGYVRGTAANLEFEVEAQRDTGVTSDEWMAAQDEALDGFFSSGRFPMLAAVATQDEFDLDLDTLFSYGLGLMLDGLAAAIAQRQRRPTPR